jgi:hypothetical protein
MDKDKHLLLLTETPPLSLSRQQLDGERIGEGEVNVFGGRGEGIVFLEGFHIERLIGFQFFS